MEIREMLAADWKAVKQIYKEGIETGTATFQNDIPSWEDWNNAHVENSRLVAIDNGQVIGWAAITPVSGRCVYAGVGEVSVYVSGSAAGKGFGKMLLTALVDESGRNGFWTLQAGIFPQNTASIKIHEHCGFRLVGKRERIGKLNGTWQDTLLFEKRSDLPQFNA